MAITSLCRYRPTAAATAGLSRLRRFRCRLRRHFCLPSFAHREYLEKVVLWPSFPPPLVQTRLRRLPSSFVSDLFPLPKLKFCHGSVPGAQCPTQFVVEGALLQNTARRLILAAVLVFFLNSRLQSQAMSADQDEQEHASRQHQSVANQSMSSEQMKAMDHHAMNMAPPKTF